MQKEHLRARRLSHGERALAASHIAIDLADARALRLRKIGLRPGPFVGRKGISQRPRVRLPDAAFDPGRPRERGLHRFNEPLL